MLQTGESLERVSSKQWSRQHSVRVPHARAACASSRASCGSVTWRGITVYDTALRQLRTIDRGDMGWVYDVASLPGGEVVVAASNGLFKMAANGEM